MKKTSITPWTYRLTVLLLLLLGLGFGWAAKNAARLLPQDQSSFDRLVMSIAGYPDMAHDALRQVYDTLSGEYIDNRIRVPRDPAIGGDGFVPIEGAERIGLAGLLLRADPARTRPGWWVLSGAFHLDGAPANAILLIAPDNTVAHRWILSEPESENFDRQPSYRTIPHGIEILPDGSVIFVVDNGASLQRFDKCGNRLWAESAAFHHAVAVDSVNDAVWSLVGPRGFARNALADGRLERYFTVDDLIAANPDGNLLELRRLMEPPVTGNPRNFRGTWLADPFHFNDVEPLPPELADRFPMASTGDLLISSRSLNAIFIVDPETLRIGWWRVGTGQRQHDPDWQPDGRITVYDNRLNRDYSRIVALDPATFEEEILFDGRRNGFFSAIRGKHQVLDDGSLVISSPQQGRAFAVDPEGEILFEVLNTKPGSEDYNYTLTEMRWLPPDFFDVKEWSCLETN